MSGYWYFCLPAGLRWKSEQDETNQSLSQSVSFKCILSISGLDFKELKFVNYLVFFIKNEYWEISRNSKVISRNCYLWNFETAFRWNRIEHMTMLCTNCVLTYLLRFFTIITIYAHMIFLHTDTDAMKYIFYKKNCLNFNFQINIYIVWLLSEAQHPPGRYNSDFDFYSSVSTSGLLP